MLVREVSRPYLAGGAHPEVIHNDAALLQHKPKLPLVGILKRLHHLTRLPSTFQTEGDLGPSKHHRRLVGT